MKFFENLFFGTLFLAQFMFKRKTIVLLFTKTTNMKLNRILLLHTLSLCLISCSISQNIVESKPNKFSVSGQLTQTSSYCGGAAPTREMEIEYQTPKPYQTKLYIRKGKENSESEPIYDSVVTDGLGNFQISLPPGDYVIILPSQQRKEIINSYLKMQGQDIHVDENCLRNWWKNGIFKVTVADKDITGLNHNFHSGCFVPAHMNCFSYSGPMPP